MDNSANNITTMGPEQIKNYQQMLLNNVLTQKLEFTKQQVKIWNDYKKRHEKVIEGLQVYPLSVSENCMVPIGKRALMKGKLVHTNEILVCLGDGYFAKYSASQAISLCNRRIEWADKMLKDLEVERNFYEMRQILALDVFEKEDGKNILEHWDEDKLDKWRVQHRQHEKEYRQKLAELREKEKTDSHTEEDLFKRLDELEVEEELKDELYRLEAERKDFYGDDLKEGEVYDESEEDASDSDEVTTTMIEEELKKLKDIQMGKITSDISTVSFNATQDEILATNAIKNEQSNVTINSAQEELRENCSSEPRNILESTKTKERKVSFVEPCILEDEYETEIFQEICSVLKQDNTCSKNSEDEDDIIRIEFSHSSHTSNISESNNIEIQSPVDIYIKFNAPKSILKRSPNDVIPNYVPPPLDEDSSTDAEDDSVKHFTFNSVIKENVQESKISISSTSDKNSEKKIVSKFKLERAGKK